MSLAHIQMVNMFSNPDPHNAAIHAMLMQLYPAFAKKVFEGSGLIGKLVRIGYDSADVLDFPICGRCESLAAYTDSYFKKGADGKMYEIPRCGCLKDGCGHITNNPTTFREWIKDEIRHKAPKSLIDELDDMIDFATDMFGRQMMSKAESDLMEILQFGKSAGSIIMSDGTAHDVPSGNVTLNKFSMSDEEFQKTL